MRRRRGSFRIAALGLALVAAGAIAPASQEPDPLARLFAAARTGRAEEVRRLLGSGAVDPDARDERDWTALMHAAAAGHAAVVRALLEAGANFRLHNDAEETALHLAVKGGHLEVVDLLLGVGADPTARDAEDRTALFRAIERRKPEIIELLQAAEEARSRRRVALPEETGDEATEPPRLVEIIPVAYTAQALHKKVEGRLVLNVLVRKDGTVGAATVLRGLEESLDRRALDLVRKWKFEPAHRRGEPVDVLVQVGIDFALPGRETPPSAL